MSALVAVLCVVVLQCISTGNIVYGIHVRYVIDWHSSPRQITLQLPVREWALQSATVNYIPFARDRLRWMITGFNNNAILGAFTTKKCSVPLEL